MEISEIIFLVDPEEKSMTKELLSVKDITEITGWSKSTVYKLVKAGQLPTVDIPEAPVRINRIKFMELNQWVALIYGIRLMSDYLTSLKCFT